MLVNCQECGKEFKTNTYRLAHSQGKYCSRDCYLKDKRKERKLLHITLKCANCGKEFDILKSELKGVKRECCSLSCKWEILWKRQREKRWSLEYDKCIACGTTEIKHRGKGRCRKCYRKTPEEKERIKKWSKKYRQRPEVKKRIKLYRQVYRQRPEVKTKRNEYSKKYFKKYFKTPHGKEVHKKQKYLRRGKYKETNIDIPWLLKLRQKTSICPLCNIEMVEDGRKFNGKTLDHIVPLNGKCGGKHIKTNVWYICRKCNISRPRDGSDIQKLKKIWKKNFLRLNISQ